MKVKVTIEKKKRKMKPGDREIANMTKDFGKFSEQKELADIADSVGNCGTTFSPAVFSAPRRCGDNFAEMQLFALDFDSGIRFAEIKARADKYRIPFVFAYHTFNSREDLEKYRVVLLHECPVDDRKAVEIILQLLMKIFPESDPHCKDVARLYCGGTDLFYYDDNERPFNIEDLVMQYYAYEYEKESTNAVKRIRNLAKSLNISIDKNDVMAIGRVCSSSIDEKNVSSDCIYIGHASFSLFFIKIGYKKDTRGEDQEKEAFKRIRLSKGKCIEDMCALYRDFKEGKQLDHNQRFRLMTNLRFIASGRTDFFAYLPMHTEDIKKWEGYYRYIVKKNYAPQSCFGCPYFDECEHGTNLICTISDADRKIIRLNKTDDYSPIGEVYEEIKDNIMDAIRQPRKGIYLISAQTAIGKTRAYCDIVAEQMGVKFIIAVPTNKLKQQVYQDLRFVEGVYMTPSYKELGLPESVIERIEYGYQCGRKASASIEIRRFMEESQYPDDPWSLACIDACERYLKNRKRLEERPRIIVTTHASLLNMSQDIIDSYTVIIDEDILLTLFQNMQTLYFDDLKEAMQNGCGNGNLESRIKELLGSPGDRYGSFDPAITTDGDPECEVSGLLEGTSYYVDETKDTVQYFVPRSLARGKYIVLSATLRSELYKMYFRDHYIYEYPRCESKYLGKLIQYTAHSLSRKDCMDKFKEVLRFAYQESGADQIITFKSYTEECRREYGIELNDAGLYFGNSAGINKLTGKDIIIIGTPHNNEIVYKLVGKYLGLDVDEALHRRRIEYNGFSFNFTTYKNPALREIQLYYIGSELEQAIGRARLLRKSCTVYLFSNFPCDQAELIQSDYLEK